MVALVYFKVMGSFPLRTIKSVEVLYAWYGDGQLLPLYNSSCIPTGNAHNTIVYDHFSDWLPLRVIRLGGS